MSAQDDYFNSNNFLYGLRSELLAPSSTRVVKKNGARFNLTRCRQGVAEVVFNPYPTMDYFNSRVISEPHFRYQTM
jgi:hypothetical protein